MVGVEINSNNRHSYRFETCPDYLKTIMLMSRKLISIKAVEETLEIYPTPLLFF
jgi:hypothetical protein